MDRAAAEAFLSPDRAAAEGAALGQLACSLDGGGLLITASRLIEFGARAAILLAPGLFRLDFTPQEETLGLFPRVLGAWEVDWRAGEESWDGYRDASGPKPIELVGHLPRARAARLDPRPVLHGARRLGHALRGQGGDPDNHRGAAAPRTPCLRSSRAQREGQRLAVAARPQALVGADRLLERDRLRVVAHRRRPARQRRRVARPADGRAVGQQRLREREAAVDQVPGGGRARVVDRSARRHRRCW